MFFNQQTLSLKDLTIRIAPSFTFRREKITVTQSTENKTKVGQRGLETETSITEISTLPQLITDLMHSQTWETVSGGFE